MLMALTSVLSFPNYFGTLKRVQKAHQYNLLNTSSICVLCFLSPLLYKWNYSMQIVAPRLALQRIIPIVKQQKVEKRSRAYTDRKHWANGTTQFYFKTWKEHLHFILGSWWSLLPDHGFWFVAPTEYIFNFKISTLDDTKSTAHHSN